MLARFGIGTLAYIQSRAGTEDNRLTSREPHRAAVSRRDERAGQAGRAAAIKEAFAISSMSAISKGGV
jgi:hypothetical protein